MTEKKSTRNLSTAEYFLQIQKEYLIAEFRKKIYYNPKDKAYWKRVMGFKKQKIEEIAKRNGLKSIFNNKEKHCYLRSILFDSNGKPKFEMTDTDKSNYFTNGNEFSYNGDIYILEKINGTSAVLHSTYNNEKFEVKTELISRIL